MRKMRLGTRKLLFRAAIVAGVLFVIILTALVANALTEDKFLAQTLAYADETPTNTAPPSPTVKQTDVDSGVHFSMHDIIWEGDTAWVKLNDGRKARLTLRRQLMETIRRSLMEHPVPYGGAVAIEPATGRILAIESASTAQPSIENYALRAMAPSASVFKLVTAAALLENNVIDPQANVCYPEGAEGGLTESHIRGTTNLTRCNNLTYAIAHSTNAVLARLAYQHLSRENLEQIAIRFGFNREIPLEVASEISTAEFVEDEIERARTAAGFWHVNLSPLHGALIAAGIINHGVIMRPTLVEAIYDAQGNLVYTMEPRPWLVAMTTPHADTLARMSEATTREGSARKVFAARKGWKKGVATGGKTGTLSNKQPFYNYNWYVGWGALNDDKIAVGALVANKETWWIKGTHVAARVIGTYFHE